MNTNAPNFTSDFELLSKYLRGFAMKLTRDRHLAEDLFQDTAFNAFKNREKFRPGTNMKAWLSTIMKNSFINGFRKKQRRSIINDTTTESFWINSGDVLVSNEGEGKVLQDEILSLVNNLDDRIKRPFLMNFQGFKYHEIAEEFGLPIGTIKSRIFMARKELKDQILTLDMSPEMSLN